MSTLGQPHPEPAWKQEVSRRLAAHKNRKGAPAEPAPAEPHNFGHSLAADAAARVAARYAKAPTYSQMQAEEARMAVRAAEIATQVALEAQAAAHSAIAELHAASEPQRGPAVVQSITRARIDSAEQAAVALVEPEIVLTPDAPERAAATEPAADVEQPTIDPVPVPVTPSQPAPPDPQPILTRHIVDGQDFGIRWEPDTPVRVLKPGPDHNPPSTHSDRAPFELAAEDWWTPAQVDATLHQEPFAVDSETAHANLIQFPRELVATRKMRPRLLEPEASSAERQLSIFEVHPGAISTQPDAATLQPAFTPSPSHPSGDWATALRSAQWSGIELDEHPLVEQRPEPDARPRPQVHLAPLGRRLMAMVVDGCLILSAFFAAATAFASHMQAMPAPRTAEVMSALGLIVAAFLYNTLFFAFAVSTPGMRYAGIALSTFDDESPTRAQLRRRLGAMVLSLAPVGLGMAWSVFDEDHLTWHDRISQTYLRKR